VFENRLLGRPFESKRAEVTGWRKLQNEELRSLFPPSINRIITPRKSIWERHVVCIEEKYMQSFDGKTCRDYHGGTDIGCMII
jgi:hypothetical protein